MLYNFHIYVKVASYEQTTTPTQDQRRQNILRTTHQGRDQRNVPKTTNRIAIHNQPTFSLKFLRQPLPLLSRSLTLPRSLWRRLFQIRLFPSSRTACRLPS
jgi:hypothetical protein